MKPEIELLFRQCQLDIGTTDFLTGLGNFAKLVRGVLEEMDAKIKRMEELSK